VPTAISNSPAFGVGYWRVAAAGDIGATFQLGCNAGSDYVASVLVDMRGVNTTTPIDTGGAVTGTTSSGTLSLTGPTLSNSGDILIWFAGMNVSVPGTLPSDFTSAQIVQAATGSNETNTTAYETGLSSGATGTISISGFPTDPAVFAVIPFQPASGATPTATATATATPTATVTQTATATQPPTATATAVSAGGHCGQMSGNSLSGLKGCRPSL
jgi:hypothetical protein